MEVVYGRQCEDRYYAHYHNIGEGVIPGPLFPKLKIIVLDGKYYLDLDENSRLDTDCCSTDRKIIFKLTCPSLFGDENSHEIVTQWNESDVEHAMKCYRIVFDGKEISGINEFFPYKYMTNVILDRSN